jgi:hypothetical protein
MVVSSTKVQCSGQISVPTPEWHKPAQLLTGRRKKSSEWSKSTGRAGGLQRPEIKTPFPTTMLSISTRVLPLLEAMQLLSHSCA